MSSEQENAQLITPATSSAPAPQLLGKRSVSERQSSALNIKIVEGSEQAQPEMNLGLTQGMAGSSLEADKENTVPGTQSKNTPRGIFSKKTPRTGKSTVYSGQSRASRSSSRQSDDISIVSATGDVYSEDEVLVALLEESEVESLDGDQEGVSLVTAQGEVSDTTVELVAVLDETTFNGDEMDHRDVIDPALLAEGQEEPTAPRSANIKRKRSSLKTPGQQSAGRRVSYDVQQPSSEISAEQAYLELPTPSRAQSTPYAHPRSDDSFYQPHHDDEDETYLQPTSPANPTPKPITKKPRKKKAATKPTRTSTAASSSSSQIQSKRRKGKSTTFPILTHRLTNTSALPTITEESEEENSDAGSASTPAPKTSTKFHDRPTPNAVDVLAQFCREDIESALENLSSTSNTTSGTAAAPTNTTAATTTSRAELKRKRLALESFNQTLETRLFTLSAAVEHRLSLEARVKKAQREKNEMRARWVEVRREREKVAASVDEMRRLKEERERERAEVRGLNEMLWRVEGEVERGGEGHRQGHRHGLGQGEKHKEKEKDGLEWMVRTVAERVSSNWGGGLLERVREFNGVLERVVGVLDSSARRS